MSCKEIRVKYKMKLDELLKQNHPPKKNDLKDVYGIIYRIFCVPENKSYIGQTFSHGYVGQYLIIHQLYIL